ncbi:MAG: class I SAM-dependent methyltransferase [Acidobacteriaceae bacterium]
MIALTRLTDHATCLSSESMGLKLQCPRCGERIGHLSETSPSDNCLLMCPDCFFHLRCELGIWKTLLPERQTYFAQFIQDYEFIRAAEGRGSARAEFYLELPFLDLSGRNTAQWGIRARTFGYIERRLLPAIVARYHRRLRILDLGAGNGWLSYRLALQGHAPTAVDLLTNDRDGLGAAIHYRKRLTTTLFPRFQAELNNLPFADGQFDLVIFNASFHYAENYEDTLAEAVRCARAGGTVMIADTPWYRKEESGRQMVEERRAAFTARYGIPSDDIASLEYLTDRRLQKMEDRFGIQWQVDTPYYGIRWSLRPLLAKLRCKREPSRFRIYTARLNP